MTWSPSARRRLTSGHHVPYERVSLKADICRRAKFILCPTAEFLGFELGELLRRAVDLPSCQSTHGQRHRARANRPAITGKTDFSRAQGESSPAAFCPTEPHCTDGLRGATPIRSRDSSYRDGNFCIARPEGAPCHFACDLLAHCPVSDQRRSADAEVRGLGRIAIGDEGHLEPLRAARNVGERLANPPARARFCGHHTTTFGKQPSAYLKCEAPKLVIGGHRASVQEEALAITPLGWSRHGDDGFNQSQRLDGGSVPREVFAHQRRCVADRIRQSVDPGSAAVGVDPTPRCRVG
jgi:hypothetical protein